MNSLHNTPFLTRLGQLQGNAFLVIIGLHTLGSASSQRQIQELLGKGKYAISAGLKALLGLELVERVGYRSWQLSDAGIDALREWGEVLLETATSPGQDSDLRQESPRVVRSSKKTSEKTKDQESNQLGAGEISPEILEAFEKAGINLNARTKMLAGRPWITADYVHRSVMQLERDGKAGQTALLIWRMERKYRPGKCSCPECHRKAFSTGLDFLENFGSTAQSSDALPTKREGGLKSLGA